MNYSKLLLFIIPLILGCVGAVFTWNKLISMRQIRGFIPGARIEKHIIREKRSDAQGSFWVSWSDKSILQVGNHRLNLPEKVWHRYEVGDEIEIVFVRNSKWPYHRDGIFASDGNFMFDYGLLAFELGLIAFAAIGAPATALFFYLREPKPLAKNKPRFGSRF